MTENVIGVVLKDNPKKVLLIQRRDIPVWCLPGGVVDSNETHQEAVIREIKEETGLDVKVIRKVSEYTPVNRLTTPTYIYECQEIGGKLTLTNETKGVNYFTIDKFPTDFFHVNMEWVNDVLEFKGEILKKKFDNITYTYLFHYFLRHPIRTFRAILSRLGFPINTK